MTQQTSLAPCVPAVRRDGALRGSSPRTHRLAMHAVTKPYNIFDECRQLHAEYTPPEGQNPLMQEALRFAQVHPRLTPVIRDDELIIGALLRGEENSSWNWLPDGAVHYIDGFANNTPPERPDLKAMATRGLISPQGSLNHKVVDYANFIRIGSATLAQRARALVETKTGAEREFALAFALGHEAMIAHAQTYANACAQMATMAAPARAAELRELARICAKVPAAPAETFHEALQSLWFAYMAAGDATGRIDAYLNDFYQADLAAGRITPARALELIECFLIKLHGDAMEGVINVSSVQTLTLGGLFADGSDATNELTRLFLHAIRNVRLLRPTVYIRCHAQTPDDVLELAVTMLGEGLAEPNFYGDLPIIDGLVRVGIPLEVARDYALSGCTEVVSPGRGNWGAPNGWINLALLADEALRDAAARGCTDTAQLWHVVAEHIEQVAEACRECNIWVDEQCGDARFTSTLLMPITLERCRDIVHGGAETYMGHWEALGLPNAADMIIAAEQLSFADGEPLASLFNRLDQGDAALYTQLKQAPKYGNDQVEVDEIAARLITLLADALERRRTPLRPVLVLGHLAGGENMHIGYGLVMGPTLDGRRQGQTLADSLAGAQGKTTGGPTAVIRSLCRLDHSKLIAGNVSTLRLGTSDFATPAARAHVVALIRTFVALGGSQLQINVVDAATLRQAQAHPDEYEGLMVRIAGYSAEFTHIGKRLQDEVIARVEGMN